MLDVERFHALKEERKAKGPAADLVGQGLRVDIDTARALQGALQLLVANIFPGQLDLHDASGLPLPVNRNGHQSSVVLPVFLKYEEFAWNMMIC